MNRSTSWILRRNVRPGHTSSYMTALNVRKTFLEYFEKEKNHLFIPSSPVLPNNNPTLSFVNAGMNQFRDVFLGEVVPASRRVVNSQRCIRIKGKHNDLTAVGTDGTHHTFFEMLGNWSFGDYSKKEACLMSWDLLTNIYKIPPERLYVTYFKGDPRFNLEPDLETFEIWAEIGVPKNRIIPFGMEENFWEMASTGPCGPCTEIHYDHVPGRTDAAALVNSQSPELTELWNLVFLEYNRKGDSELVKLKDHFIDTGMGFERLVAVLQGQTSNYETDLFFDLFKTIENFTRHHGYTRTYGENKTDIAYRIIADHARMVTVALCDGALPNMQNRIRQVFRRAWWLSKRIFGVEKGLMKELSYHVIEALSPAYPELGKSLHKVHYIMEEEEESYREREKDDTLWLDFIARRPEFAELDIHLKKEFMNGYNYIKNRILDNGIKYIPNEVAWKLIDTYGIEIKVIETVAGILNLKFHLEEFRKYQKSLENESRTSNQKKLQENILNAAQSNPQLLELGLTATDDRFKYEYEVSPDGGFRFNEVSARVMAIIVDGNITDKLEPFTLNKNSTVILVLDRTNLDHCESNHRSDAGLIEFQNGLKFNVFNVTKFGNLILHKGSFLEPSELDVVAVDAEAVVKVSETTRLPLLRSNTAMHVFKALMHQKMKIFAETACYAKVDAFNLSFTSYKESLTPKDFLELEQAFEEVMKDCTLQRELFDLAEVRKINDLIVRPGETFIQPKVPVLLITSPTLKARLPYQGMLLDTLEPIKHFIISDFCPNSYRTRQITALTGEKAETGKGRNERILKTWETLRDFSSSRFQKLENIKEEVKNVRKFLLEMNKFFLASYHIKASINEEASRKLILMDKAIRREVRFENNVAKKWFNG